ncbi:MAG: hypothetical protein HGA44_09965 [Cellulomonadaceae bacterium]|nr:hypothetical protein [Cellulomonadaceae bacterium]
MSTAKRHRHVFFDDAAPEWSCVCGCTAVQVQGPDGEVVLVEEIRVEALALLATA